jgi:hypothetical protein
MFQPWPWLMLGVCPGFDADFQGGRVTLGVHTILACRAVMPGSEFAGVQCLLGRRLAMACLHGMVLAAVGGFPAAVFQPMHPAMMGFR